MKIVCSQDELLAKLQIAARGVSQRSTVQILSGVLIRAAADGAELASSPSLASPVSATRDRRGHAAGTHAECGGSPYVAR
jgi:DNA polymerase III sliding clamp (beta) subunit (PCNA family)